MRAARVRGSHVLFFLLAGFVFLALVSGACRRRASSATSGAQGKPTSAYSLMPPGYTPPPPKPTRTLRPGEPTRLPYIPG